MSAAKEMVRFSPQILKTRNLSAVVFSIVITPPLIRSEVFCAATRELSRLPASHPHKRAVETVQAIITGVIKLVLIMLIRNRGGFKSFL